MPNKNGSQETVVTRQKTVVRSEYWAANERAEPRDFPLRIREIRGVTKSLTPLARELVN
jgi:hypothetical protein